MKLTCVTAVFNAIKAGNRERLIRCVKSVAALQTQYDEAIQNLATKTQVGVDLLRKGRPVHVILNYREDPDKEDE